MTWNEKSDIWSAACILAELYSGDLFFPTHHNVEHLAMIVKAFGEFPKWMAEASDKEFNKCFRIVNAHSHDERIVLDWPYCAENEASVNNWSSMKLLDVFIILSV